MGLRGFYAEGGDHLRFAIVGKLEVFLFQVGDHFSGGVTNNGAQENQVYAHTKGGRSVAGGDFGTIVSWGWLGRNLSRGRIVFRGQVLGA